MSLLDQFKAGKIAVNVKTEEEAKLVISFLDIIGIGFNGCDKKETKFNVYCEHTCYAGSPYQNNILNFGNIPFYSSDYKIISAAEFLGESEEENVAYTNQAKKCKGCNAEEHVVGKSFIAHISCCINCDKRIEKGEQMETLEEKKLRLQQQIVDISKDIDKLDKELEKLKFNEPWKPEIENETYYYIDKDTHIRVNGFEDSEFDNKLISHGNIFRVNKQAGQRAKEIRVYNLLKNFSDANSGLPVRGNDLIDAIFFDPSELRTEALRRYRKELEELT